MKNQSRKRKAESGAWRSAFRFPLSAFPPGLTLIELLVTICILVTVLAGVVPMLSPNNDARKIREASRQLNSMFAQAQSQAARDGRAVGVAFKKFGTSSPYSGMALEAFFVAEPPAFAGFSPNSQVMLQINANGAPLSAYRVEFIRFVLAGTPAAPPMGLPQDDPIPPNTIRLGDVVEVGGMRFRLTDYDQDGDGNSDQDLNGNNQVDPEDFEVGEYYTLTTPKADFECRWENRGSDWGVPIPEKDAPPLAVAYPGDRTTPRPYRIARQPRNTSETPLQFPTGIGIDLQASRATGQGTDEDFDAGGATTIGVMFAPNGSLQGLYFDGNVNRRVQSVFLHLGRFENGNGGQRPEDFDFIVNPSAGPDDLDQRRGRLNWLNPDSRWVAVNRAGRVITAENRTFDPTSDLFLDPIRALPTDQQEKAQYVTQKEWARQYAADMSSMGGR